MTLQTYSPERLDQLALRLLDLASNVRSLARDARQFQLTQFALHDKKALEWMARLEDWSQKTRSEMDLQMVKIRAAQLAQDHG